MVIRLLIMALLAWSGPALAQSQPLAPGEARLLILHDHANPVVSEMVRVTLRGEYDLTVALENLPFPGSDDYDWIQIDRDRWFQERIGGRMIQIFERDLAVFPRRAGRVTIAPLTHSLTAINAANVRGKVTVTSGAATLNVVPFPHEGRPLSARRLVLTDELSAPPGRLAQNDVLTRRVTIEALGTLAHALPPRPDISQPWLISFTLPERRETIPTPDGPVSRVTWEWQMRPRTGEPGVLPAVPFAWFDTDIRRIQIAAMDPIPFGFAGFAAASGTSRGIDLFSGLVMGALVAAGFGVALAGLLWGRLPALGAWWRRRRPGPHAARLHAAARGGDLIALRGAMADHAAWAGADARRRDVLARLDRQIYGGGGGGGGGTGTGTGDGDGDAAHWLRVYLGDRRWAVRAWAGAGRRAATASADPGAGSGSAAGGAGAPAEKTPRASG